MFFIILIVSSIRQYRTTLEAFSEDHLKTFYFNPLLEQMEGFVEHFLRVWFDARQMSFYCLSSNFFKWPYSKLQTCWLLANLKIILQQLIITNCFKMCKFITCLLNLSIDFFFLQEMVSLWESQECLWPGKNLKFRVPSLVISA